VSAIGVLALQGGFDAHAGALRDLGHEVRLVRSPGDLDGAEGLVLPGGESTVQWKLLESAELVEPVRRFVSSGRPILATCAGLILAARRVTASPTASDADAVAPSLGFLDVDVVRNAYGRQLDSFEGQDDARRYDLVFIRAPRITRIGSGVRVLATFSGEAILVQEGAIVAATFHPELTRSRSIHATAFGRIPELDSTDVA
jgi:pyridoxal 5'-phosphate synthase pdxT subunit